MELRISNLKKGFVSADGAPVFQLHISSLHIAAGKCIFLLGHNGSGKSVTVKLVTGELRADSGAVDVDAPEVPGQPFFGMVRQNAEESLAMDLTVRENLIVRRRSRSLSEWLFPHKALDSYVAQALAGHGELAGKADELCRNLSGGQRQILAFACATSQSPCVLVLDEFLSATDVTATSKLRKSMRRYAKETPAAVLVVSHDLEMALSDGDQILILESGTVKRHMERGDPDWSLEYLQKTVV
ncbi:MAG: ATP-binding cassette domain-containing protein [Pseudomonadota bacterium]